MSAASGLAAAKRRRGASGASGTFGGNVVRGNQTQPIPSQAPATSYPPITPMQILTQHHIRLEQIELNQEKRDNSSDIIELKAQLSKLENSESAQQYPSEDASFFREKINKLEQQIKELKALLLKVQAYSMEANVEFLKFKNNLDDEGNKSEHMVLSASTKQSKASKKNGTKVKEGGGNQSESIAPSFS